MADSLLVFPKQPLTDESQIAFSCRFGALEKTQGHIANNFTVKQVSVISNLDPNGKLMATNDPRLIYRIGQRNWHSDSYLLNGMMLRKHLARATPGVRSIIGPISASS
jgi:hypothetical protein